ncbi:MAG: hypothetical protein WBH57_10195 [Anaerolineae bacterium]
MIATLIALCMIAFAFSFGGAVATVGLVAGLRVGLPFPLCALILLACR